MANEFVQYLYHNAEKQYRVDWKYQHYECKSLLDFALIDDFVQVIDLKSTSVPVYEIPRLIKKNRYEAQVAFYTMGLSYLFPDKKIKLPILIVSSTTEPDNPQIIQISQRDFDIAIHGSTHNRLETDNGILNVNVNHLL